jgi:excisionase family DNA binding protein
MTLTAASEELLTTAETAARLRVSTRTCWRMIARGELPAIRVGGQWRIPVGELNERLQVPPAHGQRRSTPTRKAA